MSLVTEVMLGNAESECVKLGSAVMAGGVDVLYGVVDIPVAEDEEDAEVLVEEVLLDRPL